MNKIAPQAPKHRVLAKYAICAWLPWISLHYFPRRSSLVSSLGHQLSHMIMWRLPYLDQPSPYNSTSYVGPFSGFQFYALGCLSFAEMCQPLLFFLRIPPSLLRSIDARNWPWCDSISCQCSMYHIICLLRPWSSAAWYRFTWLCMRLLRFCQMGVTRSSHISR